MVGQGNYDWNFESQDKGLQGRQRKANMIIAEIT